ncbi:DEAD-box ATP-dependent RNA helicase FANCM isoform X2 [Silene latifolia]
MTGQTSPPKRASLWRSKRVFFVTPQVLEKDIQSGACLVKYLVCLVIDEAHRAMGNYAYCVAVRELTAVPVQLRILALTATPGSKQQTIQQVIDNLQISTLEYRSESDVDVCPYVQNRKVELFEVPMGKDATEINNLLLEAIRPIATRLGTMGVLPNRDYQTLSPCDLLNSRDKFRQAPPPELSSVKYSEVEGYFGVLITLYHIRKLLSSHGIRPAHEMLEEKLKQGYFARFMSRNESIEKANVMMQRSMSHGAPSPKLSKLIDVLVDHFRNNDPQKSRVIIFSNFRGSVRDILDSLAHIGHLVKATQFIGQSSGKTLKGQTQKIQQAVLEKFRTGGYNVIVATSIGEEGLDIMEVDLVICFDANVSPLRMIQRMGRTGRKHDGRVVVLACEGTEMKGYKRKLATCKTVGKHMQNGGTNSFNFHCSPRMVPHLYKPEVQFVELSIEKFVRQIKKVKTDSPQASKYREKLNDADAALLKRYFHPSREPCKLSLIAFPHFQAFPSGIHSVKHSVRAGWLIDAMQHLQGLSSTTSKLFSSNYSRSQCLTPEGSEQHIERQTAHMPGTPMDDEEQDILDSTPKISKVVPPVPAILPQKKQNVSDTSIQVGRGHSVGSLQFQINGEITETATDGAVIPLNPPNGENSPKENVVPETTDAMESESPPITAGKFDLDISDLSPRLTTFVESGFVPESPLAEDFRFDKKGDADCHSDALKNDTLFLNQSPARCLVSSFTSAQEDAVAAIQIREITPLVVANVGTCLDGETEGPSNVRTPLRNLTNSSCSEDWRMSSGEKSGTDKSLKLKRLRKIGDLAKTRRQLNTKNMASCSSANLASTDASLMVIKHGRVKKLFEDARDFIDEEAEVSSEDVVPDSEDEPNYENSDAYEDSFIDDQVDATAGSSQAEDSKLDMMAIYRRSLLSQSPYQEHQKHCTLVSPKSGPSMITIYESDDECSGKTRTQTPRSRPKSNFSGRNSVCSRVRHLTRETIPSHSNSPLVSKSTDSRKRKQNPSGAYSLPVKNLEKEFSSHSAFSSKENKPNEATVANGPDVSWPGFSDDQFYEGIDLDELEAQAAKAISQRSGASMQNRKISEPSTENTMLVSGPSFDLGI